MQFQRTWTDAHHVAVVSIQQEQGRILVDKVTDPSGSTQSFDFTLTGPELNQAFSLTDAAAPYDSGSLMPASYSVAEASVEGWTPVSATCSDGSPVDDINVEPGETVTCTFSNKQDPTALDEGPQPTGPNGVLLPMIAK